MVDNQTEQNLQPKTTPEIKPALEEAGLKLEKEARPETPGTEKKESPPPPAEQVSAQKPRRLPPKSKPPLLQPIKDEIAVKIEKIMEEGLNDSYQRLSPVAKQEFKLKGEQAALQIREILRSAHVKVKKILRLILNWLKILPGINHFFLEQEAKIKTDKIIALKNKI